MPGVVSIVEGAAGAHARSCWELLERELGLHVRQPGAVPHVSYHVSETAYGPGLLEALGRAFIGARAFDVASTGLGVFAGEPAVVYMTVTRTPELSQLQQGTWNAAEPHCAGSSPYWRESRWVPHITLAMEGLTPELAARAMALLLPLARPLEVRIDNLAVIDEVTGSHELVHRWDFAGKVA